MSTTSSSETPEPGRQDRAAFLLLALIPLAIGAAVSFAPPILNDGDTFWHIAAGRWMLQHHAVPHVDPFSYTFAGKPWHTQEWLSEVVMALVYGAAGWSGVMLLTGLAMAATAAVMAGWLRRWLQPLSCVTVLVVSLACVAPSLLARPHILVLPVLALWTSALLRARQDGRMPGLWLLPVMVLWANLHSSFIIGLGLVAALGLEAALDRRGRPSRAILGWGGFGVAALACALVTPHGLDTLTFPVRVMGMKTLPIIDEWRGPDFLKLEPVEIALLITLFAFLWRGVKVPVVRLIVVLGLLHMTLQHVRQEVVMGIVCPLLLAEPLGRALGAAAPLSPAGWRWRPGLAPALLTLGLAAALIVGRLAAPMARVDGKTAPITALAHVPLALRGQPVLNDYAFGGYLIFAGVRPYIDGRADMYGDDFVQDHEQLMRASQSSMDAAMAKFHPTWAILAPGVQLIGALQRDGWRQTYADDDAVVLVKGAK